MGLTKNIVALQKGLVVCPNDGQDNLPLVSTTNAHLMTMGYMLDGKATEMLAKANREYIVNFHDEVMKYLKLILGGDKDYKPIYKNFPQEVMNKTDIELFAGAIVHYMSNGTWEPPTVPYEKDLKFEDVKYTILAYATETKFNEIFTNLVSINTSLTKQDMEIIQWFARTNQTLVFPEVIPFKENLCTLAGIGLNVPVKTTTDVLRIAVHMSGGDISLPKLPTKFITGRIRPGIYTNSLVENVAREDFKFKKFTRSERKRILSFLEQTNCDASEMVLKSERWIRLGEILHPGEYRNKFPKAYEAFTNIREKKVHSWYSQLDNGFKKGLESGLTILSKRPGEFVRRIDWIVRTYPDNIDTIMEYFGKSAEHASNKVIFEVYEHFNRRKENETNRRIVFPKGARKPVKLPELPIIPVKTIELIQKKLKEILENKFGKLDKLGVCYVDEELKKIPLPTNMRSLNLSDKPVIRGQRTPIEMENPKVIRGYVHWVDKRGNEDLDLSATFLKKNGNEIDICSYMKPRIETGILHSGDVRHRKGNCAEYIDIDIEFAKRKGYQYAVFDVRNFNGGTLESVKSTFGVMERKYPESNNTWLPETVTHAQSLASKSVSTLICIIDLENMEYIHLDIDNEYNTAIGGIKNTQKMINQYAKLPEFSVYDLIMMHVNSRGSLAKSKDDESIDSTFNAKDYMYSYEEIGKLMGI